MRGSESLICVSVTRRAESNGVSLLFWRKSSSFLKNESNRARIFLTCNDSIMSDN